MVEIINLFGGGDPLSIAQTTRGVLGNVDCHKRDVYAGESGGIDALCLATEFDHRTFLGKVEASDRYGTQDLQVCIIVGILDVPNFFWVGFWTNGGRFDSVGGFPPVTEDRALARKDRKG